MRVYLGYALRETGANLRRNPVMTVAAILTVTVSLALFGGGLFARQTAAHAEIVWEQQTKTTVWMNSNASAAQITAVKAQLAALPYIQGSCTYEDKAHNYKEASEVIQPGVFTFLSLQDMPTSFLCTPKIPTDDTLIYSTFDHEPGVLTVTAPYKQAVQSQQFVNVTSLVLLAVSIALLISAIVLIWNTIRLAIFSRRREISVMKLVGATNWFIRFPYVTEGFVQGLVGALIASLGVVIAHAFVHSSMYAISAADVVGTDVVVVILGVAIGTLGSTFAIRKYLDV